MVQIHYSTIASIGKNWFHSPVIVKQMLFLTLLFVREILIVEWEKEKIQIIENTSTVNKAERLHL